MANNAAKEFSEFLAASARTGDRAALERLIKHWQPKLVSHAYRLSGDKELALDIVQEAWIDICRGLPSLREVVTFPAWAFRIVTRRAADAIRKKQRNRRGNAAIVAEPGPIDRSGELMDVHADRLPLANAMKLLPADQHIAIALHYLEEFSVNEIALALEVPAGTIKTRLMHARRKLRATLEGETHDG
jgi:RNA polymerase sigma factor (sigma-70 family)